MGLDMYLYAKRYVSNYNPADAELRTELDKLEDMTGFPIQEVKCEAFYWRKANAVHKWFVDNVQEGVDDCGEYFVPDAKLRELLDICIQVRADNKLSAKLLPTASGFFFGDTSYDEWYFDSLERTIVGLEKVCPYLGVVDFYYQSSW